LTEIHPEVASPSPQAAAQIDAWLALLLKWNARMNLTAIRDPEEILRRHVAESIFAATLVPASAHTLLDYGSGAGLPGIPIAVARPELAVTLAESQGKKASFLREAVRTLGLNAEVWAERVEAMAAGRVFDTVTLRAVDKMAEACRAAVARLAPGGTLLVFSTEELESSLDTLQGIRWQRSVAIPGARQSLIRVGLRA
jgi:16S rRNA (guanine527-N7)-methyltransferase